MPPHRKYKHTHQSCSWLDWLHPHHLAFTCQKQIRSMTKEVFNLLTLLYTKSTTCHRIRLITPLYPLTDGRVTSKGNIHLKHLLLNPQFVSCRGFFFVTLKWPRCFKSNWKGFQRWSKTLIAYWFKELLGDAIVLVECLGLNKGFTVRHPTGMACEY